MFTSINRTVFDIPLTWDRTRFEASRVKCRQARKLIELSINAQFNKQLKDVFYQKLDIEKDIIDSQERLINQERKVRVLDNLTEVALQSLTDYFDKRMEHVRSAIQEHCNAIQQILREENEHWNEIHTAIDQNLITSDDLHPPNNIESEIPLANIHTINEVDEEEHTSKLLTNKTVTPLLTQMIRKSRLLSNHQSINKSIRPSINKSNHPSINESIRPSINESNRPSSTKNLIQSKQERFSIIVPLASARRTLPVIDTTFVVKLEESRNTEVNQSSSQIEVVPIESLPSAEVETLSSYSQPKLPARLYFSPTLLQDDEEPELIQPVLSIIDQNQTNIQKPKIISHRFGQTFLLDNIKNEELNQSEDTENLRPKISDEIPFMIHCDPTLLPENESQHLEIVEHTKSIVYTKRRTRAVPITKIEPEAPIHITRRTTRNKKPIKEIEINKKQTRKRKQSTSDDGTNTTVALRKKKAVPPPSPPPAKTNTRKTRAKKAKEIPIREPSPLPIIDRSKHYSTRFSTRSHRFNNLTLSTTTTIDDDHNNKSKHSSTRLRTKSTGRSHHHHDNDDDDDQILSKPRSKQTKTQSKQRAKSMMTTRSRRK